MEINKLPFKVSLLAMAVALTACNSDNKKSDPEPTTPPSEESPVVEEPGVVVSGMTMSVAGGAGVAQSDTVEGAEGGEGGYIYISKYNSASALKVVKEARIVTDYELPAQEVQLGSVPAVVSASTSVTLIDASYEGVPAVGELYVIHYDFRNGGPGDTYNTMRLYLADGVNPIGAPERQVTGLQVDADATLIIPANYNGESDVNLYFENDIVNNGKIFTADPSNSSRTDLELTASAYYGAGEIDLKGNNDSFPGQSGGEIEINAHTIQNSGVFNTSGANADGGEGGEGGYAGSIDLNAFVFVENQGQLIANGGGSADYQGQDGGDIQLNAIDVYNTGSIEANGGPGAYGDRYYRSNTDIELSGFKIINTGSITANGASANAGNGGRGGDIRFNVAGAEGGEGGEFNFDRKLINTGDLTANGGSLSEMASGYAGQGGYISFTAEGTKTKIDAQISGNLSAQGGSASGENADYAGAGGSINIDIYDLPTSTIETLIAGYDLLDATGAEGAEGGRGGYIDIAFEDYRDDRGGGYHMPAPSGPLMNEVQLDAQAGSTLAAAVAEGATEYNGYGARGGSVSLYIENGFSELQEGVLTLDNTGAINVSGGNSYGWGDTYSSRAGNVQVTAPGSVTMVAGIEAMGGVDNRVAESGADYGHEGGDAGSVYLSSAMDKLTFEGAINAVGGTGSLEGGDGGMVYMMAKTALAASGEYNLSAGNTVADELDGLDTQGGDAGHMFVLSEAYNSEVTATVTATTGTGDEVGEDSVQSVDAECLTANCTETGGFGFGSGPK